MILKFPDLDTLRSWCRERLAGYKAPEQLVVVDELPLTSMLKVDKSALASMVNDGSPGRAPVRRAQGAVP